MLVGARRYEFVSMGRLSEPTTVRPSSHSGIAFSDVSTASLALLL